MQDAKDEKEKKPIFSGKLLICSDSLLNESCFGYRYNGNLVCNDTLCVIKRIEKRRCTENWNRYFRHQSWLKHLNVQQILQWEENDEHRFFAVENYRSNLFSYCKRAYFEPMPSYANVLCDIAQGMCFIHSKGLLHGNITPRNILVVEYPFVHMKVSDFGISSTTILAKNDEDIDHVKYWIPNSNIVRENQNINFENIMKFNKTLKGDIFSIGCIFFYYLTRGSHLFCEDPVDFAKILLNIKDEFAANIKMLMGIKDLSEDEFIKSEILKMVSSNVIDDALKKIIVHYEENGLRIARA